MDRGVLHPSGWGPWGLEVAAVGAASPLGQEGSWSCREPAIVLNVRDTQVEDLASLLSMCGSWRRTCFPPNPFPGAISLSTKGPGIWGANILHKLEYSLHSVNKKALFPPE